MNRKLKIGILGCSSIAERKIIPALHKNRHFILGYIASRSNEKAKLFAGKYGCIPLKYEELIKCNEIDAIYVSVPSGLHYRWGKKIILSNKHVLLEKPFTHSYEKSKELIALSRNRNIVAMEGLSYIYHPQYDKLLNVVNECGLGKVKLIEAKFGFPHLPSQDIRYNYKLGGGAILDNLIYPLSAAIGLGGKNFKKIKYNLVFNHDLNIDTAGYIRMDWKEYSANLTYGFGFYYQNNISIWLEKGIIKIDRVFSKPENEVGLIHVMSDKGHETIKIAKADQFNIMFDKFYDKITGKDKSGINENEDILIRNKIISNLLIKIRQ
jgi:dTDP-3,4-didehydro-2,6-dideoxy-alpha-D-glucose 3-reductase